MLNNESNPPASGTPEALPPNRRSTLILTLGAGLGLAGLAYGVHARNESARTVESQQAAFQTSMTQMQQQMQQEVQSLQNRLAQQERKKAEPESRKPEPQAVKTESQPPKVELRPAVAPPRTAVVRPSTARRAHVQRPPAPVEDPRIKQMEQRLADHDEKLSNTQRLVESTRSDLTNQLKSTSEELHGSIARTSEEVAALQRRGERDYVEFDIPKAKDLRRVGPFSLALRKTDTKHKRYNVEMLVSDNKLEKKNVNLLEPVYISSPEWPQPVELVVNRVDKDRIRGYISTPKYKRSESAATTAASRTRLQSEPGSSAEPD